MKNVILMIGLLISTLTLCQAQQIEIQKVFGGYKFTKNGHFMTMGELANTLKTNSEAYELIKPAKSNNTLATILGVGGGALIGWPIGTALGGGDPNWVLAGVGAGLLVIAIPISSSANKKAKEAVELYNSSLEPTSFYQAKPSLKIIANSNGIGFAINF